MKTSNTHLEKLSNFITSHLEIASYRTFGLPVRIIDYGKIDKVILFGGSSCFPHLCDYLNQLGIRVVIVTSSHQLATFKLSQLCNAVRIIVSTNPAQDDNVLSEITTSTSALSYSAVWIFKKSFIDLFSGKFVNIHFSLLPSDKGGGGLSYGLMSGQSKTGITIHELTPSTDKGDIYYQKTLRFKRWHNTPLSRSLTYQKYARSMLQAYFRRVAKQPRFKLFPMSEQGSSYWPRINSDIHAYINWEWTASQISQFIMAFGEPYPGAITFINEKRILLKNVIMYSSPIQYHPFQKGIIIHKDEIGMHVCAEAAILVITSATYEDGSPANPHVKLGDRFYTPNIYLDEAMQTRSFYMSSGFEAKPKSS